MNAGIFFGGVERWTQAGRCRFLLLPNERFLAFGSFAPPSQAWRYARTITGRCRLYGHAEHIVRFRHRIRRTRTVLVNSLLLQQQHRRTVTFRHRRSSRWHHWRIARTVASRLSPFQRIGTVRLARPISKGFANRIVRNSNAVRFAILESIAQKWF